MKKCQHPGCDQWFIPKYNNMGLYCPEHSSRKHEKRRQIMKLNGNRKDLENDKQVREWRRDLFNNYSPFIPTI